MKSMGLKLLFGAATALGLCATSANADPITVLGGTLSAYVAVQSDYRFRGISQNDQQPSEEASATWNGPDGFYVGTWLAKIDWDAGKPNNPSLEVDVFGGKNFDLGDGTNLNVEAYYYSYPDFNNFGGALKSASYYETIVQLSHTFGPLALTATGSNSPEWSLGGGTGWYVEGTAVYTINDWLSLTGDVGHQWVASAPSDYTHYDIGATATYHNLSLYAGYTGTDISSAACTGFWTFYPTASRCSGGFTATLTYNINPFPW